MAKKKKRKSAPTWTPDPSIMNVKTLVSYRTVTADIVYSRLFWGVFPYKKVVKHIVTECSNPESTAQSFRDKTHPFVAQYNS